MENNILGSTPSSDTLPTSAQQTGRMPTGAVPSDHPGTGPSGQTLFPRLTPAYFVRVLRHRWKLMLLLGVTASLIGGAVDYVLPTTPTTYSTNALIRVEPAEILPGATAAKAEPNDLKTQTELVKTRFILSAALDQGPAAELPSVKQDRAAVLKRLSTDLKVEPVGPQILRLTLTGADPEELPILVNAVKEAYLREVVGNEQTRRRKRKEFLEEAYRDCEKRLRDKRKETIAVKAKPDTKEGANERVTFERFALFQHELFRIEMDLQRSRLDLTLGGRDKSGAEVSTVLVDDLAEKDPFIRQQRDLIAQMDSKVANWERTTINPESHLQYQNLKRDRKSLADLADARKRDLVRQYSDKGVATREKKTSELQERTTRLEAEEKMIHDLVDRGWDELKEQNNGNPELTLKRFEIERLEAIAKQLTDELEGLRMETASITRTASLQDAAEPVGKKGSRQLLRTAIATAIPFLFVIAFVSIWELCSRRIFGQNDVRNLGIPVLGIVPRLGNHTSLHNQPEGGWPNSVTDSIDVVCASLLWEAGIGSQVIMITSATPQEGKSTLARHLAARLARTGKKTLLLDADLYRPTVHTAYGVPVGPGLCEVLNGTVTTAVAIQTTQVDDLFVLPAGKAGPDSFRQMARGALTAVLDDLRSSFDIVIIDTSPVLATSQPLLVGRLADTVVLTTLCAVSRSNLLVDAIRRLTDLGIPVAGVIVSGAADASRYGYYFQPAIPDSPVELTLS